MLLKDIIARGNTAEVYSTDDEKLVVKLFFEGYSHETVEHEYHNAKIVAAAAFDKPDVYEMLEINGRFGIVYERIPARTLLEYALANGKTADWIGEKLAELHARMLSCPCSSEIETDKDYYRRFISYSVMLSEEEKARAFSLLAALPRGGSLCHGDYHPQNVTTDGEKSVIIDFMNVYLGNPASDIARAYYLVALSPLPAEMPPEKRAELDGLKRAVGETYAAKMEAAGFAGWREWLPVILAARSGDGIVEEEQRYAGERFRMCKAEQG